MKRKIRPTDLHEYDEYLMRLPDATEEERQQAFRVLLRHDALDIADMLGL